MSRHPGTSDGGLSGDWTQRYKMLVEDTLRSSTQYLAAVCRKETAEHRAKTFHGLVLRGKLWTAVRWITER